MSLLRETFKRAALAAHYVGLAIPEAKGACQSRKTDCGSEDADDEGAREEGE